MNDDYDISQWVRPGIDDAEPHVSIGLEGFLAGSERLLAVARGEEEPDARDAPAFKRIYSPDRLMRERIRLDTGGLRRAVMRHAARNRNLGGLYPGVFDDHTVGQVVSNPLTTPLEETNPLQVAEQMRRITGMGPGGVGSDDAITGDMQAVQDSQAGFISPIAGPESSRAGVDVRPSFGTRLGADGRIYQRFRNRRTGDIEWLSPADLADKTVGLPP